MIKLSKVYYSSSGLWKGHTAVSKLAEKAGVTEEKAKAWLEKQALWQIYLPPPKHVPRPHWTVSKPDEIHQADLLFLPHDTVNRKTYKYALVVVDIASRYKDAEALSTKNSSEVAKAFEKLYSRVLNWPKTLIVDPGSEFQGDVTRIMNIYDVKVKRSEAGNHRAQAFVERANKTLGEKIFSHQYAEDLVNDTRSRKWVKRLPGIMHALNTTVTRLTGEAAIKAHNKQTVDVKQVNYDRDVGFKEKRLGSRNLVRYLLRPGEEEGGEVRRATNPVWSWEMYLRWPKSVTAKANHSRRKQITHGESKLLTAKVNSLTAKANRSRQKKIAHGKRKSLTAKENRSRRKQIAHGESKSIAAKANRSRRKQNAHGESKSPTAKENRSRQERLYRTLGLGTSSHRKALWNMFKMAAILVFFTSTW